VVLAVWAPWCPHCQAELPVLAAVTTEFPKVSLVSVATAVDPSGPTPMQYMQATGLDFPVALDDSAGTLAQAFGIRGFPTIFFVGADGSIRAVHEGEMSAADLRSVLGTL
jgi:thiol-disulfide isomerase/thioredoxin